MAFDVTGYGQAIVHACWHRAPDGVVRPVFALVELLPYEFGSPCGVPHQAADLGKEGYVYWRRAVVPATEAVQWYSDVVEGRWRSPNERVMDGQDDVLGSKDPHSIGAIGSEPAWPNLNLYHDNTPVRLSFIPAHWEEVRVSSCVPLAPSELCSLKAFPQIAELLLEFLGVRLADAPEWTGSVHFVAQDPVLRGVRTRLVRGVDGNEVAVAISPSFRVNAPPSDIDLTLTDERATGSQTLFKGTIGASVEVLVGQRVSAVAYEVYVNGVLLRKSGAHSFWRGGQPKVSTALGVSRTITLRADKVRPNSRTYSDTVYGPWDGGEPQVQARVDVRTVLNDAERSRARAAGRVAKTCVWFDSAPEDAEAFVRDLVKRAQRRLIIVDPYFGADEAKRFLTAVSRTQMLSRVLGWSEHLKARADTYEGDVSALDSTSTTHEPNTNSAKRGTVLQRLIRVGDLPGRVEVRVMSGKFGGIHDRFLVVDEHLWSIGSSLNNLGKRPTLILRVPEPEPIIAALEDAWKDSIPLDDWCQSKASGGQ